MIADSPPPPPARVQVVAQEFSYSLSRRKVKAGKVIADHRERGMQAVLRVVR